MSFLPSDIPREQALVTLELLGFHLVRERGHIAMRRENPDGSSTFLTLPNHPRIHASTLKAISTIDVVETHF